jgi:pSer/pThr/pTyr-binding forkhead associated (FHA) protein
MNASAHYRHLLTLGRDEFLAAAAPAALVRYKTREPAQTAPVMTTATIKADRVETLDAAMSHGTVTPEPIEMEIYPLAKKPGALFRDRITIGRTPNNDVVIGDSSVSRLHAYVRQAEGWIVADAGSKNGSWLGDARLEARREIALPPGALLRFGDVQLMFYPSDQLFDVLGGSHGRR